MVKTRRAELRDSPAIEKLTTEQITAQNTNAAKAHAPPVDVAYHLSQRFGNLTNIEKLIDSSPMSIVSLDKHGRVTAFAAFSASPPSLSLPTNLASNESTSEYLTLVDYSTYLTTNWSCGPGLTPSAAKFMTYYVGGSAEHLDAILSSAFLAMQKTTSIVYFLPDGYGLYAPLCVGKTVGEAVPNVAAAEGKEVHEKVRDEKDKRRPLEQKARGGKDGGNELYFGKVEKAVGGTVGYNMYACKRSQVLPRFCVRKARVEDTDDLAPMLRKQKLLGEEENDFFLSDLLQYRDDDTRTLVAEVDSQVVGFMSLSSEYDQKALSDTFDVSAFDFLKHESEFSARPTPIARSRSASNAPTPASVFREEASVELGGKPRVNPELEEDDQVGGMLSPAIDLTKSQTADRFHGDLNMSMNKGDLNMSMAKGALNMSMNRTSEQTRPQTAYGEPNAFCIRLFYMDEPYHNYVLEVIKQAFKHFPDREYCIATVPSSSVAIGPFPIIQSKLGSTDRECLYIINRFALSEPIVVSKTVVSTDIKDVRNLTAGLVNSHSILHDYVKCDPFYTNNAVLSAKYESYVASHEDQIIGIAVFKNIVDDIDALISQFDIENFIKVPCHDLKTKPVMMKRFVMNPLFEHQARYFMGEVMRIACMTTILYAVDENAVDDFASLKITRTELIPVRRRRQIQYPKDIREGKRVAKPFEYPLQIMTLGVLYEPKIIVNTKIIVLGASDAGISFLESLVYAPHLVFNNLTLVSSNGIASPSDALNQIGLEHYVRVIKSSTTEIDRQNKTIKLKNGLNLPYDYLVLTPGIQFDVKTLSEKLVGLKSVYGISRGNEGYIDTAIKLFVASCQSAGVDADGSVKPIVLVYGKNIQVYTTIQLLLSKGVPSSNITLVLPKSKIDGKETFDNAKVESIMKSVVVKLGVTLYDQYKLEQWEVLNGSLVSATIKDGAGESVAIPNIELFLYADEKTVESNTFKAINDSCLVFDGLLIIDKYFRTQDSNIFAAGSLCKYSSKYKTPWSHSYYNSREIGAAMAKLILPLFNPVLDASRLHDDDQVLQFKSAKSVSCVLPSGLHYFFFDKPRLPISTLKVRQDAVSYGRDCVVEGGNEYFRIHVDAHGDIQSLTYVGAAKLPVDNIGCLYGMNEKTLNRFVSRFDSTPFTIPSLLSFLSDDWALFLYHDRFKSFFQTLNSEMMGSSDGEMRGLVYKMGRLGKGGRVVTEAERGVCYDWFNGMGVRKEWDMKVFEYILECMVYDSFP